MAANTVPLVRTPRGSRSNTGLWVMTGLCVAATLALACVLLVAFGGLPSFTANSPPSDGTKSGVDPLPGSTGDALPPGQKGLSQSEAAVQKAVDGGVAYLKMRLLDSRKNLYYYGQDDDANIGAAALTGMTLVECDVSPKDTAVQKAIKMVKDRQGKLSFTYSVALSILFLDRLLDQKEKDRQPTELEKKQYTAIIQDMALQLIYNQHVKGGWNYKVLLLTPTQRESLLAQLKNGTFDPENRPEPDLENKVYRDNSISQFVVLALWSARKHGIPAEKTLLFEEKNYRDDQNPDGSWDYSRTAHRSRDATSCAGLISLAIGHAIRSEIEEKKAGTTPAKKDEKKFDVTKDLAVASGLKFISKRIGSSAAVPLSTVAKRQHQTEALDNLHEQLLGKWQMSPIKELRFQYDQINLEYLKALRLDPKAEKPETKALESQRDAAKAKVGVEFTQLDIGSVQAKIRKIDEEDQDLPTGMIFGSDAWGDLYFLWSLERVSVIYGLEKIQGKDWYTWGKNIILKQQKDDGSWRERFPGVPDTCFALLFLKRINIVKDLTDKLQRLLAALFAPGNHPPPPGAPPRKDIA